MTDPLFSKDDLLVISLGGNAVLPLGKSGTIHQQFDTTRRTMGVVAGLAKAGVRLLLSHGNGPIVGNIVIRNECASHLVTPMPLFICGADSQGGIGFMIQNALQNELHLIGETRQVATVVSQVEVDLADPAFENPSKPIGPFYRPDEARVMEREKGWTLVEDSGRGWRRVVPSPRPKRIFEIRPISWLLEKGCVVICAGGGGIPTVYDQQGRLQGVEAVIDKDLCSALLAEQLGADLLVIAPATANIIAKIANGIADELVSTLALACHGQCDILLAPAMNTRMWQSPAVQENIQRLTSRAVHIVGPMEGRLASGAVGIGRMAEPVEIIAAIEKILQKVTPKNIS